MAGGGAGIVEPVGTVAGPAEPAGVDDDPASVEVLKLCPVGVVMAFIFLSLQVLDFSVEATLLGRVSNVARGALTL